MSAVQPNPSTRISRRAALLLLSSSAFAGLQRPTSTAISESEVRMLIGAWIEAYQKLDAKRLTGLETPEVEIVDSFGELHLPSGRRENEKLWADTFETIAKDSAPPAATIDHMRFIRPEVALVRVSWRFPEGILLVDGDRLSPFSQLDTYLVVKSDGTWPIAAHNMQRKT